MLNWPRSEKMTPPAVMAGPRFGRPAAGGRGREDAVSLSSAGTCRPCDWRQRRLVVVATSAPASIIATSAPRAARACAVDGAGRTVVAGR